LSIQTLALPGASKEGFLSREVLEAQARAQTADTFQKVYAFPALHVVDITMGAPDSKGDRDRTMQAGGQLLTLLKGNASAFRYLHETSFLVKRPGNPFPQFISVGRAANNDIVFAVDSVSKFHGYFTIDADRWFVTDFRSTNGTEVNSKRIEPTVPTLVNDGDRIRFGEHVVALFLEPASLHAKLRS
jgi:hypothetical protein